MATEMSLPAYQVINNCCVWHWKDELSDAEGWIVIHSPKPVASGGGLFLHEAATLQEVMDVAYSMSLKLAISCQPHVAGAKGGIRFSSSDPRASEVLERFIRDNAAIISQYWGTGGDLNTSHTKINEHAKAYFDPGTLGALDALLHQLHCPASMMDDVPILLEEPVEEGDWSLEEYSVGYVMACTLRELLLRMAPDMMGRARMAMQGFGCVGATFARAVQELGIGRVVGISSEHGFLLDETGIACDAVEKARRRHARTDGPPHAQPRTLEAGLSLAELHSDRYVVRQEILTDEEHLQSFLAASEPDIFVPCAQRYVLTDRVISTLARETCAREAPGGPRFVVSGANNIFDPIQDRADVLSRLDSASITMLPEWVSNSGTGNLFMRACSGLATRGNVASNLSACVYDTTSFLDAVFGRVGKNVSSQALWQACEEVALERKKAGAINDLGIRSISHLSLSRHGDDDIDAPAARVAPTLDAIKALLETAHAGTSLSVHFSVFNLEKTRQALAAKEMPYRQRMREDGMRELVILGREAGYSLSFCQPLAAESGATGGYGHIHASARILCAVREFNLYVASIPDDEVARLFHENIMGFTPQQMLVLERKAYVRTHLESEA